MEVTSLISSFCSLPASGSCWVPQLSSEDSVSMFTAVIATTGGCTLDPISLQNARPQVYNNYDKGFCVSVVHEYFLVAQIQALPNCIE